jgi:hypothetical protein
MPQRSMLSLVVTYSARDNGLSARRGLVAFFLLRSWTFCALALSAKDLASLLGTYYAEMEHGTAR